MEKERIKTIRQAKGWTWEEMARELGVSWRTVARWESGESRPNEMARRFLVDQEIKSGLRLSSEEEIVRRIFRALNLALQSWGVARPEKEVQALAERIYELTRGGVVGGE